MYKLHKISQRFLCRIPIDSKQGTPGPPALLCAMVHVYPYPGAPTPIPMVPHTYYLHTYIHALIHLFIYLIVFVFVYLIVFVSLTPLFSLLSCSLSSRSLLALGKACPWAEAAGLSSLMRANIFILFNYYPVVHMYGMVCMYPHVLYSVCVCIIYYTCIQQMYVCT